MFQVNISVREAEWLSQPEIRWNAGLQKAGLNFRQGLQRNRYPAIPPSSKYTRTYMTADKANFKITEPGKVLEFGSTYYLQFLLVPTRTVMNWAGKREELINLMQLGFKAGVKDFSGGL